MTSKVKLLHIQTTQGYAGTLVRESQIVFNYRAGSTAQEIGLTMPLTAKSYSHIGCNNRRALHQMHRQSSPE
ncbi:HipA N-terminal domain-containing protein [Actimicrobium sp. CCI2.3]